METIGNGWDVWQGEITGGADVVKRGESAASGWLEVIEFNLETIIKGEVADMETELVGVQTVDGCCVTVVFAELVENTLSSNGGGLADINDDDESETKCQQNKK